MNVWAVVPVKELDQAKERLAAVLTPEGRRALMLAMLVLGSGMTATRQTNAVGSRYRAVAL